MSNALGDEARRRQSRRPRRPNDSGEIVRPAPYDPLALTNLGTSIERALLETKPVPISSIPQTAGPGIYAIYYTGEQEMYAPISRREVPIYVGKAILQGGRKGLADQEKEGFSLWSRLQEHKASLEAAVNLDVANFEARYLVVVPFFVSLAEEMMIRHFRPVWNLILEGFGNHDPGAGRRSLSQRPAWDEVHPGRQWSAPDKMPKANRFGPDVWHDRIQKHLMSPMEVKLDAMVNGEPTLDLDVGE